MARKNLFLDYTNLKNAIHYLRKQIRGERFQLDDRCSEVFAAHIVLDALLGEGGVQV